MRLPVAWLKQYIDVSLSSCALEEVLTMSGSKVEGVETNNGEAIFEIEVTTNRPDCLSILGLAREVSALTGKKVCLPKSYTSKKKSDKVARNPFFQIIIEAKKACPKYTARLIRDVCIGASPQEIEKSLGWMNVRGISNVVDATNFVLFESGQPLHAFDFDKIEGGKILVRYSVEGEIFLALDGSQHTLDGKTLVIADEKKPIALAGIMGGKLTEVTSSTKNILLESAYFDPGLIRQAGRKYRISTDSSYRFERGVDPAMVEPASERAASLITQWATGSEDTGLVVKESSKAEQRPSPIVLRLGRVEKILGMKISAKRILSILKALSISAKLSGKDKIVVTAPSARRDIIIEEDIIEEILRIEGFEKIPTLIPATRYGQTDPSDTKSARIFELKKMMATLGFSEIITYSLLSAKVLQKAGWQTELAHKVVNAVSAEQEYFRPGLMPGALEVAVFNLNRKAVSLKLFEIGNCCYRGVEHTGLGLFFYGFSENHWLRKNEASFYDLKGIVGNIFSRMGLKNILFTDAVKPVSGFGQSLEVLYDGRRVATVGRVSDAVAKKFDLPHEAFYADLNLDTILTLPLPVLREKNVGKFPEVRRDIAFILDEKIRVVDIEALIWKTAEPFVREVTLFDQYIGKNIPEKKRSLAFSLAYQKDDGTFTDEEILKLQERVYHALRTEWAVEFR